LSAIQEQQSYSMSNDNDTGFRDRLSRAAEARSATLAKVKRALDPENPGRREAATA
jgi:hypothetical protein